MVLITFFSSEAWSKLQFFLRFGCGLYMCVWLWAAGHCSVWFLCCLGLSVQGRWCYFSWSALSSGTQKWGWFWSCLLEHTNWGAWGGHCILSWKSLALNAQCHRIQPRAPRGSCVLMHFPSWWVLLVFKSSWSEAGSCCCLPAWNISRAGLELMVLGQLGSTFGRVFRWCGSG